MYRSPPIDDAPQPSGLCFYVGSVSDVCYPNKRHDAPHALEGFYEGVEVLEHHALACGCTALTRVGNVIVIPELEHHRWCPLSGSGQQLTTYHGD